MKKSIYGFARSLSVTFSQISSLAQRLTPFGVIFRYPDVEIYPKKQTVLSAIHDADKILRFVEERIIMLA
jgi:hypothetical protein